jgi:hypothetical protein
MKYTDIYKKDFSDKVYWHINVTVMNITKSIILFPDICFWNCK